MTGPGQHLPTGKAARAPTTKPRLLTAGRRLARQLVLAIPAVALSAWLGWWAVIPVLLFVVFLWAGFKDR